MNGPTASTGSIVRARQDFLATGLQPAEFLAPHIRRSWSRSQSLAVAAPAEPLARALLAEQREAAEWLLRCAQPEMDALADHAVQQGCVVLLSDAQGLILEEIGCPDFLPKAQRVALQPGAMWSEDQRGTNAIGTALAEREAVMVLGPEHWLQENAAIGCAAAPILNGRGELAGVLDLSGDSLRMDAHALGLVRLAATQVEHRMLSQGQRWFESDEIVRFHWRAGLLGTPREGLVAVREGRIVGLNRCAVELLGGGWSPWLNQPIEQIFERQWPALRQVPGLFTAPSGRTWAVAVEVRTVPVRATPVTPVQTVAVRGDTLPVAVPVRADPEAALDADMATLDRARRVLDAGLAVLVRGETGVGKDVFTRRLHALSRRAGKPLVTVNCAALPASLIEAELFGYEEGAFTGARRGGSAGRLREAHGGLLFLDEIGDMPLDMQSRLLRVLEARRVRPLGAAREIEVDFDLVCATHQNLDALVEQGRFREDLLYRLRGFELQLPALRERSDRRDFIQARFDELASANPDHVQLSTAALDRLEAHAWPGNVRELMATLRAALALAEPGRVLEVSDLNLRPHLSPSASETLPIGCARAPSVSMASLTERAFQEALRQTGGNVSAAARALGVHRTTLYRHAAKQPPSVGNGMPAEP